MSKKMLKLMNPKIDLYLAQGCMRCKFGGTPECKVHNWQIELAMLRQIVLDSGLKEELKWGVPCYTFHGINIVLLGAFKEYAVISFFKGVLLSDTHQILQKPGENSQSGRIIKFTHPDQITAIKEVLPEYIAQAIALEKSGAKVEFAPNPEPLPAELLLKFERDEVFKTAFYRLSPGKQRGYVIYFSQPKQSQSRANRIESCAQKILNGEALYQPKKQ